MSDKLITEDFSLEQIDLLNDFLNEDMTSDVIFLGHWDAQMMGDPAFTSSVFWSLEEKGLIECDWEDEWSSTPDEIWEAKDRLISEGYDPEEDGLASYGCAFRLTPLGLTLMRDKPFHKAAFEGAIKPDEKK
tara:strand:- start:44 stop:439 length:396 start_codon:yes stop_codon:yes gene_type:complete